MQRSVLNRFAVVGMESLRRLVGSLARLIRRPVRRLVEGAPARRVAEGDADCAPARPVGRVVFAPDADRVVWDGTGGFDGLGSKEDDKHGFAKGRPVVDMVSPT